MRTAIHPLDAAHARAQGCIIDEALEPGARIGPLVVVAAAGKSPGEVALHWPARRSLFVGDAVILLAHVTDGLPPYEYQWFQASGPPAALLTDPDRQVVQVTFASPGIFAFDVFVLDATDALVEDRIELVVRNQRIVDAVADPGGSGP